MVPEGVQFINELHDSILELHDSILSFAVLEKENAYGSVAINRTWDSSIGGKCRP